MSPENNTPEEYEPSRFEEETGSRRQPTEEEMRQAQEAFSRTTEEDTDQSDEPTDADNEAPEEEEENSADQDIEAEAAQPPDNNYQFPLIMGTHMNPEEWSDEENEKFRHNLEKTRKALRDAKSLGETQSPDPKDQDNPPQTESSEQTTQDEEE